MKKDNAPFTALSLKEGRRYAKEIGSPFLTATWEDELVKAFPYISFAYFLYNNTHLVRLANIKGRVSSVPFSDGGDIYALSPLPLSLSLFAEDVQKRFGPVPEIRVHSFFCPVVDTDSYTADLVDFRVSLAGFGASSLRKTLRHIVAGALPDSVVMRAATEEKDIRSAFLLYVRTMRRVCAPALPFKTFAHLAAHTLFIAQSNGEIHGASLFVKGGKTTHYFLSMIDTEGKECNLAHHMLFMALKHFRDLGAEAVFLGGTRVGSSLEVFKEGWRGNPYPIFTLSRSREATRTSPLRSLWRYLPLSLVPWASRFLGKYLF